MILLIKTVVTYFQFLFISEQCLSSKLLTLNILTARGLSIVYMGPEPSGTGIKLVQISFAFTRDLSDPVRSTYEDGPIWNHTVPVSNRSHVNSVVRTIVDPSQTDLNISDPFYLV